MNICFEILTTPLPRRYLDWSCNYYGTSLDPPLQWQSEPTRSKLAKLRLKIQVDHGHEESLNLHKALCLYCLFACFLLVHLCKQVPS